MKKLLIAITLMLVFGITSAAIALGRGGFGSGDTGAGAGGGGGGSVDVVRGPRGARNTSADGGFFGQYKGTGMGGFYMLSDREGGAYSLTGSAGGNAPGGPVNGTSFEDWLRMAEAHLARATAPGNRGSGDADASRYGYSARAPLANFQPLGFSGNGNSNRSSDSSGITGTPDTDDSFQAPTVVVELTTVAAAVPEPETYAMLLAGLALLGAVVRRRKSQR